MSKFWYVALHEYTRHVFRRRFFFTLLVFPVFVFVAIFVILLVTNIDQESQPIGYVDHSGSLLSSSSTDDTVSTAQILKYDSEAQAHAALLSNQIQAYYVIAGDYPRSTRVKLVALTPPNGATQSRFEDLLRARLLSDFPPEVIRRLKQGNHLVINTIGDKGQFRQQDLLIFLLPILALFVFFLVILSTSGYLMHAMTEEKENRTMEIIITSISPVKMMVAKITAIVGIGITLLGFWFALIILGIGISPNASNTLDSFSISLGVAFLFVTTSLLAFVMIAAIIAAVGSIVTEATEGQQITSPFSVPFIIPYFFLFQIMTNPNGTLALVFSFIPFTAPVTLLMRVSFAQIPTWQILLSLAVQVFFALFLIWIAGRAFRLGMLQYGRHLTWRDFFITNDHTI